MKCLKIFASIILLMVIFIGCLSPNDKDELKKGEFFVCDTCEFDSLIVKYKEGVSIDKANSPLNSYGDITTRTMSNNTKVDIVKIDREKINVENLLVELNSRTDIEYAEPNYIMRAAFTPNDTYYQYQWHLAQLNMPDAWDIEMGDSSVKVAVIDTGVAYDLSDLSGTNFDLTNDKDFINNDMDAYDDNSHGTHCAGTVAQTTNNNSGVAGMAPGITILPLKVLADCGSGSTDGIADAVIWAADHDVDIISMSLGGGSYSQTMVDALSYAYNNGVTIFAATGNDNGSVSYPAAYNDYVIAVGATRYDKARAPYSNYGSAIDIVAPGGDTSVDQNNDGYVDGVLQQTIAGFTPNNPNNPCAGGTTDYTPGYYFYQGTSMACPHAAGLGALLKSYKADATPAEIREAIENSAEDLGSTGWDQYYGHGLIDPVAALNYIGGSTPDTEDPTVSITGPSTTSSANINITVTGTDNVGVTGYYVKENSSSTPTVNDPNWVSSAPTTFTLSAEGTHNIYAWTKDAAGNISNYDYFTVVYSTGGGSVHRVETISDSLSYYLDRTDIWTIDVAEGEINLELSFSTSNGCDIDLYLYNPSGTLVAYSEGTTSTEIISYDTNGVSGTYEVKIYMYNIYWYKRYKSRSYDLELDWYEPTN